MNKSHSTYHATRRIGLLTLGFFAMDYVLRATNVYAICPVCTAAALGGVGLSRWLGIDDLASGVWIGGALASMTGWTVNWLNAKGIKFWGRNVLLALFYYGFVVIPFYYKDLITHPRNKYIGMTYIGIDKLILGIIVGTIVFVLSVMAYEVLKRENSGHAHFPFEKIAFPVGTLLIVSVIFYFITK